MSDQLVELFEGTLVQQQFHTLASREFAFLVLPLIACFASALIRRRVPAVKLVQPTHQKTAGSSHLL